MTLPRPATSDDVHEIVNLIKSLVAHEKEPGAVRLTPKWLREQLFGDNPAVFCHVVDPTSGNLGDCAGGGIGDGGIGSGGVGGSSSRLDGITLWFLNYSTWEGTHGTYLEDPYVRPGTRDIGKGKALLQNLARTAVERGYSRVEWRILKWNQPSIDFYRSLGASPMDDRDAFRLTGQPLADFGAQKIVVWQCDGVAFQLRCVCAVKSPDADSC